MKMYQKIAQAAEMLHCGTQQYEERAEERVAELEKKLPSGSGIDSGTKIDRGPTNANRIVLLVDYHHMNDLGFYVGWATYTVTVNASLAWGIEIQAEGGDADTREYLEEVFYQALREEIE